MKIRPLVGAHEWNVWDVEIKEGSDICFHAPVSHIGRVRGNLTFCVLSNGRDAMSQLIITVLLWVCMWFLSSSMDKQSRLVPYRFLRATVSVCRAQREQPNISKREGRALKLFSTSAACWNFLEEPRCRIKQQPPDDDDTTKRKFEDGVINLGCTALWISTFSGGF